MEHEKQIRRACEIVTEYECEHLETCYTEDDIRILSAFKDEYLETVIHVLLMTNNNVYDVIFNEDEPHPHIVMEIYASCDFRRYDISED